MDKTVGNIYTVETALSCGTIILNVSPERYSYPFFVLELLDKPEVTVLKPFDHVLARDENDRSWEIDIYHEHDEKELFSNICLNNCWKQCIPYEGNEHLLGTTNDA